MRQARVLFAAAILAGLSGLPALAHEPDAGWTPVDRCWARGPMLECMAGHANGRPDPGLSVTLYAEDGRMIASARADAKGFARFVQPTGPFYVLIGDKRGDTVEVTWRDVDATRPRGR